MGLWEGLIGVGALMLVVGAVYEIESLVYAGVTLIIIPFIAKALIEAFTG